VPTSLWDVTKQAGLHRDTTSFSMFSTRIRATSVCFKRFRVLRTRQIRLSPMARQENRHRVSSVPVHVQHEVMATLDGCSPTVSRTSEVAHNDVSAVRLRTVCYASRLASPLNSLPPPSDRYPVK
jgi:hypothetical protein